MGICNFFAFLEGDKLQNGRLEYNFGHGFLSRNALKYFAVACMTCDHIAVAFVNEEPMRTVLTFLGGLTMPIMSFFLAEGYVHTRNVKKYAARLFIFALLSIFPFCYLSTGGRLPIEIVSGRVSSSAMSIPLSGGSLVIYRANFLFTLLLSLINIIAWDKLKIPVPFKVIITAAVCWLSTGCDWGYWCVLISFVFWKFRDNQVLKWALYSLVSLSCVFYFKAFQNPLLFYITYSFRPVHLDLFLIIPLLAFCYNGEKGSGGKFGKWFFYIFYPAHLLIIDIVLVCLSG